MFTLPSKHAAVLSSTFNNEQNRRLSRARHSAPWLPKVRFPRGGRGSPPWTPTTRESLLQV